MKMEDSSQRCSRCALCSLCFQSWNFCRVTGLRTGDNPPIVMEASDLACAELLL